MSSTEILAAAALTALTPRWWAGREDDAGGSGEEGDDAADACGGRDWGTGALRSALRDPYGQEFRPHLFGI